VLANELGVGSTIKCVAEIKPTCEVEGYSRITVLVGTL
jgi:hypothetical protein